MRQRRPVLLRSLAIATGVIAIGALAACSSESSAGGGSVKPTSYSIGAALPLSGPSTALGQYFQRGVATAVQEINNAGGINGAKLSVYYADNQLQAAASVTAMNQLISTHDTQAVIMTSSAGVTATAPLATRDKVLMMNPGGEDPTLQKLSPNLISNIPNVKTEVDVMLPYLKQQGYKRMAMYAEGDALGATTTDLVSRNGPSWAATSSASSPSRSPSWTTRRPSRSSSR